MQRDSCIRLCALVALSFVCVRTCLSVPPTFIKPSAHGLQVPGVIASVIFVKTVLGLDAKEQKKDLVQESNVSDDQSQASLLTWGGSAMGAMAAETEYAKRITRPGVHQLPRFAKGRSVMVSLVGSLVGGFAGALADELGASAVIIKAGNVLKELKCGGSADN